MRMHGYRSWSGRSKSSTLSMEQRIWGGLRRLRLGWGITELGLARGTLYALNLVMMSEKLVSTKKGEGKAPWTVLGLLDFLCRRNRFTDLDREYYTGLRQPLSSTIALPFATFNTLVTLVLLAHSPCKVCCHQGAPYLSMKMNWNASRTMQSHHKHTCGVQMTIRMVNHIEWIFPRFVFTYFYPSLVCGRKEGKAHHRIPPPRIL